ncbi:fused MFS/spermidine synthase [Bacteroidota bacterium]
MKKSENKKFILLIIAFFEGAAVMACELFGAKMIAPFFGTTIYSWAGVLAVTLFALASGYYVGGMLTTRINSIKLLYVILLSSGLFLFLMPYISQFIMIASKNLPIINGLILSLMVFTFPPIFFFGMVSPVIIHSLVSSIDITGKTAGKVYAISTIGGVLNTLFLGFYIIPEFGIRMPAFIYGAFMILLPTITLLNKKWLYSFIALIIFFMFFSSKAVTKDKKFHKTFNVIYSSEGLLGQVKVLDFNIQMKNFGALNPRGLLVNNTWQTLINKNDQLSLLDYVYFINPLLSRYNEGSDVLLIGLGGGTLTKEIQKRKMHIEVVELDQRLKDISVKYFGLDPLTKVIIDDGRHFLESTKNKYDVIILDAFLGENPPWQLLTLESFNKIKSLLNPGGSVILEFFGFIEGDMGAGTRSVYKTMEGAGFKVDMIGTRHQKEERNFILIGTENGFDFDKLEYNDFTYSDQRITNLRDFIFDISPIDFKSSPILTDDNPLLEKLMMQPSLDWRKNLNEIFRNRLIEDNQPIFY